MQLERDGLYNSLFQLLSGAKEKFDLISLVKKTIQHSCQDAECITDINDIAILEKEILRNLNDSPDELCSVFVQVEY